MTISRGQFLRSLGKSLPGYALGSATAIGSKLLAAAQRSGSPPLMTSAATPEPGIEFIKSGPAHGRNIALTFDDGPAPGSTEKILDELKSRNCQATFFMIGREVAAHPEIAKRVLAEGHEIGNHTFNHPKLTTLPQAQVEEEIHDTQEQIWQVLGRKPSWFRPPFGELGQQQAALVARFGMRIALWSVNPNDWSSPPKAQIMNTLVNQPEPGSILICHDNQDHTSDIMGEILDGLLRRDFKLVTLSELFA